MQNFYMQQNSVKNIRGRKLLHTEVKKSILFFFGDYFCALLFLQRGCGVFTRVQYSQYDKAGGRPTPSARQGRTPY